jgi:hypothetical protein
LRNAGDGGKQWAPMNLRRFQSHMMKSLLTTFVRHPATSPPKFVAYELKYVHLSDPFHTEHQ